MFFLIFLWSSLVGQSVKAQQLLEALEGEQIPNGAISTHGYIVPCMVSTSWQDFSNIQFETNIGVFLNVVYGIEEGCTIVPYKDMRGNTVVRNTLLYRQMASYIGGGSGGILGDSILSVGSTGSLGIINWINIIY